ncbi:MAG: exbD 5 [Firmicutes bacterium]|nr:exbD 5 [Bacillota bacterium]
MNLNKLRSPRSPKLMIIPMIDIIFFLLVFFMMSTLYMVEQNVLPIALPQSTSSQTDQTALTPITLTAQGNILIGQEEISREILSIRIKAELYRNPETSFLLRADRQIEYGRVIELLDELKRLGVRRVAVATELKP